MNELKYMGETLWCEWETDTYAEEVWILMNQIDDSLEETLQGLRQIAQSGSTLAALYLSDILFFGHYGASRDESEAISWADYAAQRGSIEGSFLLAQFLEDTGSFAAAEEEYIRVAERGYSPAMYRLARKYWTGMDFEKDAKKSVFYFSEAIRNGHLYAKADLARLKRAGRFGFWAQIGGLADFFSLIPSMVVMLLLHPGSDVLRR